jgi:adhesin HecA-like repeat protein
MDEGQVVEVLVTQTSILLAGVGVFASIVSVYLAGLNYFLHEESLFTRFIAFFVMTIILAFLMIMMMGAETQHAGLIARLRELEAQGQLTAAGRASLANSGVVIAGRTMTIDSAVIAFIWMSVAVSYVSMIFLTFFYRWRPSRGAKGLTP